MAACRETARERAGLMKLNPADVIKRLFFLPSRRRTKFLVLLPIHRPPALLKYAVASIMQQTEQDFQLHIIGDGAPDATTQELLALARNDRRITSHVCAKGERNGEAHRDPVIRDAEADFVCQIADDDMWFPNHLSEIEHLLSEFEFGHTLQVEAAPGARVRPLLGDISDPETASRMVEERFNIFGPTASGYRKTAYLKLEKGWSPAPTDIWTDLHMWRKFLSHGAIKCGTRFSFTHLHVSAPSHAEMTIDEREAINKDWSRIISNPAALDHLKQTLKRHALLNNAGTWCVLDPHG